MLAATDVSVVDVARDTTVMVNFEIPSKDAGDFTIRARFLASVTDEIAVVRAGTSDLPMALESYLSGHYPFQEIGQSHNLADFNEVRLLINARAKAFTTFMPPALPGLNLRFISAEVLTPRESRDFYASLRTETHKTSLVDIQRRNAQGQELDRTTFENVTADLNQTGRNDAADQQLRSDLDRFHTMWAEVPSDLMSLMRYAAATGQIPYSELIEAIRQIEPDTDRADSHTDRDAALQVILELLQDRHLLTRALPGLETAIQHLRTGSADPPRTNASAPRPSRAELSLQRVDALLDRGSLGTTDATALQNQVSDTDVEEVLRLAQELQRVDALLDDGSLGATAATALQSSVDDRDVADTIDLASTMLSGEESVPGSRPPDRSEHEDTEARDDNDH
ncbi:hypothetical protein ACFXHA_43165 [Nocardia sp. NPDC059240]|uniref:hypothetical protein n=1 Tax=Nocardia sp. NPDC059240 TaxID=3346786 RepID=UPI0036AE055D